MERKKTHFRGVCTCDGKKVVETGRRMPVTYDYETMTAKQKKSRQNKLVNVDIPRKQRLLGIHVEEPQQPEPQVTFMYFTRMWDTLRELTAEQAKEHVNRGIKVFALDSNGITYSVEFKGLELITTKLED